MAACFFPIYPRFIVPWFFRNGALSRHIRPLPVRPGPEARWPAPTQPWWNISGKAGTEGKPGEGLEGRGYWAPGKFRKIFRPAPPILWWQPISVAAERLASVYFCFAGSERPHGRRLYIHLSTSCFIARNAYNIANLWKLYEERYKK